MDVDKYEEFIKRICKMDSDNFIFKKIELSKNYKKFSEDWQINIDIANIKNITNEYNIKVNSNGTLICSCKDFGTRAKNMNIICKHIIYFLNKYDEINYEYFLEYGFILNKSLLKIYEDICNDILRCQSCLCINKKLKYFNKNKKHICDICDYYINRYN